jgi:hypothetical protein
MCILFDFLLTKINLIFLNCIDFFFYIYIIKLMIHIKLIAATVHIQCNVFLFCSYFDYLSLGH